MSAPSVGITTPHVSNPSEIRQVGWNDITPIKPIIAVDGCVGLKCRDHDIGSESHQAAMACHEHHPSHVAAKRIGARRQYGDHTDRMSGSRHRRVPGSHSRTSDGMSWVTTLKTRQCQKNCAAIAPMQPNPTKCQGHDTRGRYMCLALP